VFIPRLVELIRQDRFPLARLVKSYGLHEVNAAADASLSGATIKPVLVMA
jgi:aryl-alcohol dehydrogenase